MSWPCVVLGICLVWLMAIIIHLGVTLIGASDHTLFFDSNTSLCLVVQRSDRGYVLSAMWILSIVVVLILAFLYVRKLIGEFKITRRTERLINLCSLGCTGPDDVLKFVRNLQTIIQRTKCYTLFLACFTLTTSPLFVALLLDRKFVLPSYLFGWLGSIAYFHVCLIPISYFLIMKNIVWRLPYDPIKRYYSRIGNRLR